MVKILIKEWTGDEEGLWDRIQTTGRVFLDIDEGHIMDDRT